MKSKKLTIVTATLNCAETITSLASSIARQSDTNFDWVVFDGGSTDCTIEIIRSIYPLANINVACDFGLYDALNKAIKLSSTDYYMVIGGDDYLYTDAVLSINRTIASKIFDIYTGCVVTDNNIILKPATIPRFRSGHLFYVSQHSVGSIIKKSLHEDVGFYSNFFPIAADKHFLLKAIEKYSKSVHYFDSVLGFYSTKGISSTKYFDSFLDSFRVDYHHTNRKLLITVLFLLKFTYNIPKFLVSKN
jgi:glycosyltransferase involved in cell wall biosynthesis